MDDLTDLRGFADLCKDLGNKAHITPGDSQYMRALWGAETRLKDCADLIEEQAALLREAEDIMRIVISPKLASDMAQEWLTKLEARK